MGNDYLEQHEHSVILMVRRIAYRMLPLLALSDDDLRAAQQLFDPYARPLSTEELLRQLSDLPDLDRDDPYGRMVKAIRAIARDIQKTFQWARRNRVSPEQAILHLPKTADVYSAVVLKILVPNPFEGFGKEIISVLREMNRKNEKMPEHLRDLLITHKDEISTEVKKLEGDLDVALDSIKDRLGERSSTELSALQDELREIKDTLVHREVLAEVIGELLDEKLPVGVRNLDALQQRLQEESSHVQNRVKELSDNLTQRINEGREERVKLDTTLSTIVDDDLEPIKENLSHLEEEIRKMDARLAEFIRLSASRIN